LVLGEQAGIGGCLVLELRGEHLLRNAVLLARRIGQTKQAGAVVLGGYVGHGITGIQATTSTASRPGAVASVPS
jgi:hypothetical protein